MEFLDKRLLNNNSYFVETPRLNEEVERIIALEEQNRRALLVYSSEKSGKNHAFKNAINKREGNKIVIDFNDNSMMCHFPGYHIVRRIYNKLEEFGVEYNEPFPEIEEAGSAEDLETYVDSKLGVLKRDLYCLKLDEPLYILICNADKPFNYDPSLTFYYHFLFDKRDLPENLHVFIITSSETQAKENEEFIETVRLESNLDDPKIFFRNLLKEHSYEISDFDLINANDNLKIHDYIYIAGYVLNYSEPKDYDAALKTLLRKNNSDEILMHVYQEFFSKLTPNGGAIFTEALLDLGMFRYGLTKNQILESGKYLLGSENHYLNDYEEIEESEKELVLSYLEYFTVDEMDRLIISDQLIFQFVCSKVDYFTDMLTINCRRRVMAAIDYIFFSKEEIRVGKYKANKYVYLNAYLKPEYFDEVNLVKHALFDPLCARLTEFINNYCAIIKDAPPDLSYMSANGLTLLMMAYIDSATAIYEAAGDYGIFQHLFKEDLMFVLVAKSKKLVRRLINREINANFNFQKKEYNDKTDSESVSRIIVYSFEHLFEGESFLVHREILINVVISVLEENNMLNDYTFSNKYKESPYVASPMYDFVEANASSRTTMQWRSFELSLMRDPDSGDTLSQIKQFISEYESTESVYEKFIYAYMAMKGFIYLGDKRELGDNNIELLSPITSEILYYTEYCYYPEVYGVIYMYFGRIYPTECLYRLQRGITILKSLGYNSFVKPFELANEHYSSSKKEDK